MIPADDLKLDLYITVVERTRHVDYSFCGDALLIKAVNPPIWLWIKLEERAW